MSVFFISVAAGVRKQPPSTDAKKTHMLSNKCRVSRHLVSSGGKMPGGVSLLLERLYGFSSVQYTREMLYASS